MAEAAAETIVIVGAGVSGLACARELVDGGQAPVVVLERASGVGGRCATRRMDGQQVDFGVAFFHGRNPEFLRALAAVPGTVLAGWPSSIVGSGSPCEPEAFAPNEQRLAFAEGVGAFPRGLAHGLDVRLAKRVIQLTVGAQSMVLRMDDGDTLAGATIVLALAAEQARSLLATVPSPAMGLRAATAILGMTRSHPCLSLIAMYPRSVTTPEWHASYPESSEVMQMASHDSTKRPSGSMLAMVYQGHPRWSRQHLGDKEWPRLMLDEAGRLFGGWAATPRVTHEHQWTYARQDLSSELSGPMLIDLPGGVRLGLCGDRFAPGGGVEAAWLSGLLLGRRLNATPRPAR